MIRYLTGGHDSPFHDDLSRYFGADKRDEVEIRSICLPVRPFIRRRAMLQLSFKASGVIINEMGRYSPFHEDRSRHCWRGRVR